MKPEDMERLLADENDITPSPKFLTSVMEAVHREVAAPRPVEFPWLRALPGLVATVAALAVAMWDGIGAWSDPGASAAFTADLRELMAVAASLGLQWVVLAVAITILSVWLPFQLTRTEARLSR